MRAHLSQESPVGMDIALHASEGLIGAQRVVCVLAGKGQLQIPARTERAIEHWRPRDVFLIGIAGGFVDRGVRRGDVVIAKYTYFFDFGKLERNGGFVRRPDFDAGPSPWLLDAAVIQGSRPTWRRRLRTPRPDDRDVATSAVHDGYVASSNTLVDNPEDVWFARVRKSVDELDAVEMEGAGAATAIKQAQDLYQVRFLMVRGISDEPGTVAGAGSAERRAWKAYAADVAASFVSELAAEMTQQTGAAGGRRYRGAVEQRSNWARMTLEPQTLPGIPRVGVIERILVAMKRGMKGPSRIVAVVGPAGYGKSTVLGQIYDALSELRA